MNKVYKETKKVLLGKQDVKSQYKNLIEYISKEFNIKVINIFVDTLKIRKQLENRIWIIVKTNEECEPFINHEYKNNVLDPFGTEYNKKLYNEIMLNHKEIIKYPEQKTFIVYKAFENDAIHEYYGKLPNNFFKKLKRNFCEEIWEIRNLWSMNYVMVYTNNQIDKCKEKYESTLQNLIFQEIKKYDFCNLINSKEDIEITFDSKENFDNKYEGSWFYYTR